MQYLILGSMPNNADPKTHIAAGEWCFLECSSHFPRWMDKFSIVDSRLDPKEDERYVKQLMNFGICQIHEYAQRGNIALSSSLSTYAWELLLGRWCTTALSYIGLAYLVATQAVRQYGHLRMTVPVAPSAHCSWLRSSDFFTDMVTGKGFYWVLSRVVEKIAPSTWNLVPGPAFTPSSPQHSPLFFLCADWLYRKIRLHRGQGISRRTLAGMIWQRFSDSLPDLAVPKFPFTSIWQRLLLTAVLLSNRKHEQEAKYSLHQRFLQDAHQFPVWMGELLWACLPQEYHSIESRVIPRKTIFKAWVMGDRYYRSIEDSLFYASLAAGGTRLYTVQHAPCYGVFPITTISASEEYNHAGMMTWGKLPQPCNAIPAVPLCYNALRNTHNEKESTIYYILDNQRPINTNNTMSLWSSVRGNKNNLEAFYKALPEHLQNSMHLRHYDGGRGAFDSRQWSLGQALPARDGDNIANMQRVRVVVVDYIASSFGQAMMLNVPCLWIWNPRGYTYSRQTQELFVHLQESGIMHKSPQAAAEFLARHWSNMAGWWQDTQVQEARSMFLVLDSGPYSKHPIRDWAYALRTL